MMNARDHHEGSDAWQSAGQAGEDLEQLDWLLSLSPTQRLRLHEGARKAVAAVRQAGRKFYGFDPANPDQAD